MQQHIQYITGSSFTTSLCHDGMGGGRVYFDGLGGGRISTCHDGMGGGRIQNQCDGLGGGR